MPDRADVPKIRVENVTKTFEERRRQSRHPLSGSDRGDIVMVIDGVSLDVREGELVMLIGHSGCGKSTLLNMIAGFERPTAGRILLDGVEVSEPDPRRMFVFQENALFPWLTVGENVALGLDAADPGERSTVPELLRLVGLSDYGDYYPHQISGGMGRLAELARALAMGPDVLLMDEPFAALDFMTRCLMREEVLNLMALLRKTVVFITHDLDEAVQMADRIVVLGDCPARIRQVFEIPDPHPRDIGAGELGRLRRRVYLEMGVNPIL